MSRIFLLACLALFASLALSGVPVQVDAQALGRAMMAGAAVGTTAAVTNRAIGRAGERHDDRKETADAEKAEADMLAKCPPCTCATVDPTTATTTVTTTATTSAALVTTDDNNE
ncbi:hypothetical protein NFJ02_19g34740 [Pycnococcus provasolii]|uniref:Secreted protein n=1 Tax=Pycnococcus provasolii TaxID=41880 RepID=A0A7S3DYI0_9CHLO|mmetsp:Transcript_1708/g.4108  ORF Transcript_1708/g.4108 Transcript_1708/m.4108 type:complete len:114 (+) Transcript_1708:162-503(+)